MPDESSLLLPRHEQQSTQPADRSGSLEHVRRRTGFFVSKEYDNDELIRNRSRLSSYSVVNVPEHLKKDKRADETEHIESADEEGTAGGGAEVDEQPDSKYKNVSAGRFWLVFLTIMTGR